MYRMIKKHYTVMDMEKLKEGLCGFHSLSSILTDKFNHDNIDLHTS